MLLEGKPVGLTTGTDVDAMKDKLFKGYFHISPPVKRKRRRSR